MTDRQLYEAFLKGEVSAFEQLVLRYRPRLILFLTRLVRDTDAAEDLAQDVFAYLYVYKESYDCYRPFSSFLYTLAHRRGVDYIRKQARVVPMEQSPLEEGDQEQLEREIFRREDAQSLAKAMRCLKPDYQAALYLVYFEGLSHKEVAKVLEKTQPQVKVLMFRARQALKKQLEKEGYRHEI